MNTAEPIALAASYRLVAIDETRHWKLPDVLATCKAFGIYAVCIGERTYCCSLTPSSWYEFVEHVFVRIDGAELDEAQSEAAGDLMFEGGWDNNFYGPFIGTYEPRARMSAPVIVEYECDEDASEDDEHRAQWDAIREHAQSNPPHIPGL